MSSTFGKNIHVSVAGESHGEALGVIMDGFPAGFHVDMEALSAFLARRAPGRNQFSTPRKEADAPKFLSGLLNDVTTGAPILAIIENTNTKSADYAALADIPRPGHADYTAHVKYGGFADMRGGGHFSGRLTAPLTVAGGIARQMLFEKGISVFAHIRAIGGVWGEAPAYCESDIPALAAVAEKDFPAFDEVAAPRMEAAIDAAREAGDSVGGSIEVSVLGLPAGLGSPMFARAEGRISSAVWGVPAVRGIEFGEGFGAAHLRGSENNDAFYYDGDGVVRTRTNHAGGILGGITTGEPLVFRVAIKPTPSIFKEQESISLSKKEGATLKIQGRHDPCIVPRAVPVLEAVTALAVLDLLFDHDMCYNKER